MPFKNRADRLAYINKYNGPYYKKNRSAILEQKKIYHTENRAAIVVKMAARRVGKEKEASARTRAWYASNKQKALGTARKIRLLNAYGLRPEQFAVLKKKQKGKCAICGKQPKLGLCVDHCHRTKKVRGLLCRKCNSGIGLLQDSASLVRKALAYLEQP